MDKFPSIIMNEYLSFKKKLKEMINNYSNKITSGYCYLVDESLIIHLNQIYNEYIKGLNSPIQKNNNTKISNFKKNFHTINDFSTLMTNLTNNKKFEFVSPEFENYLCNETFLTINEPVYIYGIYNKLIIKFQNKIPNQNQNKALLLFNPFDYNGIQTKNLFIIDNKKELFEYILNKDFLNPNTIKNETILKNLAIPFEKFISNDISFSVLKDKNLLNENNDKASYQKEILKIFISLFYYEKFYKNYKENIFSKINDNFLLINYNWWNKYKQFLKEKNLYKIFQISEMENKDIEYDNLEYNMNKVIISVNKYYQNKFPKNILDFFEEIYPSKDTKYNIDYFGICTIIPEKIFIMIKDILPKFKEIEIPKIKILENNNFLLIYHNKNFFEIINYYLYLNIF